MNIENSLSYSHELKLYGICYVQMANILINQKDYNSAIKVLLKGLESVWLYNDKENECLIYDKIGIVYYL